MDIDAGVVRAFLSPTLYVSVRSLFGTATDATRGVWG
jgi:hypothetical protein